MRDIGQIWSRVQEIVGSIKHPDLKGLIEEFLSDEPLMDAFRRAPAAAAVCRATKILTA